MKSQLKLIVTLSLFQLSSASAWEIDQFLGNSIGWLGNSANVRYSGVSFPSWYRLHNSLNTVLSNRWNRNPSLFNFSIITGDMNVGHSNFQNETWMEYARIYKVIEDNYVNLSPPAEAFSWTLGANFIEADVVFYKAPKNMPELIKNEIPPPVWNSDMDMDLITPYANGGMETFETAAMHEFGHFLGLNHENDEYNIMGDSWKHIHVNNGVARSYPGEDASDGAVEIYGEDNMADEDLSVVHFEWAGRDGEYSIHNFTDLRDTNGNRLQNTPSGVAYKTYTVRKGQEIQVEFTYENNGLSLQTSEVGFYISSDDNITASDDLFATEVIKVNRNSVFTKTFTLKLPIPVVTGERYLGVFIDHNNTLDEFDENNNVAHFKLEVVSPELERDPIDWSVQPTF